MNSNRAVGTDDSHLLSVDLEDWHTTGFLKDSLSVGELPVSCINEATLPILDLFEESGHIATFFVLGSIASEVPSLIRKISEKGHEIASHGYSHTPLWYLDEVKLRNEIRMTSNIISSITGHSVKGFRAPYASLDRSTSWAIKVLEEEGYQYDSSIFPMRTPLYGVRGAHRDVYRISADNIRADSSSASLLEIPFSVCGPEFFPIPCTGGIYGRFLPYPVLRILLKKVSARRPLNFYFHPWETFSGIPRRDVGCMNRIISYYNTGGYLKKIRKVLKQYKFTSFEKFISIKNYG